ncbi:OFA family MFS transporter [uncultured Veillonella sp.]|uniref:L-lactate MFS transporter n=1 Tax=uncultured Veillonella sp. TaxID=159268 RepID=UPI0028EB2074|nr:OFA family MFS transporter [uncultured Veillonella sp.]
MRNRWLIALAAIGLHISIGSVYAWSVLTRPIMADMGFTMSQTTWTFSLAILMLGLSAGFLGSFAERIGPKKSGLLSMLFWVAGLLGTAYALSIHNLTLLYLFYGIVGGIGLGIGYITPVSTLVKYFPHRPGFATGLAIMGFGFASLIAGPLMQYLVAQVGLVNNFIILGIIYLVVMGAASLYLNVPSNNHPTRTAKDKSTMYVHNHGMLANDAMKTWQFGALWWIFFVNITCGIGLLSLASPMAQEAVGMTPAAAASLVGIIGIFNGFGRIAWSTISDYFGRAQTYILFFIIQIIAFYVLAQTNNALTFQILILLIITCYGGGFACMPAYLADLYGIRQLSTIHGRILTAWGLAGIVGPMLVSYFHEAGYGYSTALVCFALLFVLNTFIAIILKIYGKRGLHN